MKPGYDQTQINNLNDRHIPRISRVISCNRSLKGYRQNQARATAAKHSEKTRSVAIKTLRVAGQVAYLHKLQLRSPQIAVKLIARHEALYQHVYSNNSRCVTLLKNLRFWKQTKKYYMRGRHRWDPILHKRNLNVCSAHSGARKQVVHKECETIIDANQKGAIATTVDGKNNFKVIVEAHHKTPELVNRTTVQGLRPFTDRVKTLSYDSSKEYAAHIQIDQALKRNGYVAGQPLASWIQGSSNTFNALLLQYVSKNKSLNEVPSMKFQ